MKMDLDKIKNRGREFISLGVIISLIIIIAEIVGIEVLKSFIAKETSAIQATNERVQGRTKILEEHFLLKRESDEAEELAIALKQQLASKDELLQLSKEFGRIAESLGVDVSTSFTTETQELSELLGQIGITLSIASDDISGIVDFLTAVDSSRFLVKLSSFDMNTDGNSKRFIGRGHVVYRNK